MSCSSDNILPKFVSSDDLFMSRIRNDKAFSKYRLGRFCWGLREQVKSVNTSLMIKAHAR